MVQRVEAKYFHPMRGHVEDGAEVLFSDGRVLAIKGVNGGWALIDKDERQVGPISTGAYELTAAIVQMEGAA